MHLRSPVRLRPFTPYCGATLLPFGYDTPASFAKGEPAALKPARNERAKAGDETRTRDIFLGKEVLYQLSYTRAEMKDPYLAPA